VAHVRIAFSGFWNKNVGILGAIASTVTFVSTLTIIPFIPDGWAASAGGFPQWLVRPLLNEGVVLLAVSIYLLKQDVVRASAPASDRDACPTLFVQIERKITMTDDILHWLPDANCSRGLELWRLAAFRSFGRPRGLARAAPADAYNGSGPCCRAFDMCVRRNGDCSTLNS